MALPAGVGLLANHLVWGVFCSFAILWVLMCDVGGAYRVRWSDDEFGTFSQHLRCIPARCAGPTVRGMRLRALIEQLDDVARTLVTLREELNLAGRDKWSVEFRERFTALTNALAHLGREIADAVAVAGRNVKPTHLQDDFQRLESAITAKSQKDALFQLKEIYRTTKHLIEQACALAETVSELNSGHQRFREPPEARFEPRPKTFDPLVRNPEYYIVSFQQFSPFSSAWRGVSHRRSARRRPTPGQRILDSDEGCDRAETKFRKNTAAFRTTNHRNCVRRAACSAACAGVTGTMAAMGHSTVLPALVFGTFALRNLNYTLFSLALAVDA